MHHLLIWPPGQSGHNDQIRLTEQDLLGFVVDLVIRAKVFEEPGWTWAS